MTGVVGLLSGVLLVSWSLYKFISWNTGADGVVVGLKLLSAMSKSGGRGKSASILFGSVGVSLPFGYMFGFVLHALQIGAVIRFGCVRA